MNFLLDFSTETELQRHGHLGVFQSRNVAMSQQEGERWAQIYERGNDVLNAVKVLVFIT